MADDLAQETFVRAYRRIDTLKNTAQFSSWLYRIAYRSFLSEIRKKKLALSEDIDQHGPEDQGRPQSQSMQLQLDLEQAMGLCSETERAAIALCYAKGMSHQEAAQIMDVPLGTVKTHIARGKEKMRSRLTAWEGRV